MLHHARHHFASGWNCTEKYEEFKQIHPITKYDHYESFVQRIFDGEENVLSKDSPIFAVLDFFRCIENNWQKMVQDIRLGTISNDSLIIAPDIKQKLLDELEPNSPRADELLYLFEEGLENIANRVWSDLQYISSRKNDRRDESLEY